MKRLSGLFTAAITPFKENRLHSEALVELIGVQKRAGVDGLVALGTTAETATLSEKEREKILEIVQREKEELALIVNVGAPSTQATIDNCEKAAIYGADAVMAICPYYIKPTQEGLLRHYEAIARQSPLPLILYNVPSRTLTEIQLETLTRLIEIPNIIGIKESGSFLHSVDTLMLIQERRKEFLFYVGEDKHAHALLALGANGLISGGANVFPELFVSLIQKHLDQDYEGANALFKQLYPLLRALSIETNPIAVKAAMNLLGMPGGIPRLPLTEISKENLKKVEEALEGAMAER